MPATFEVPVFSPAAARVAVAHGATRLELNRAGSYAVGGLTPTRAEVEAAAAAVAASAVPLRVMIRPRGAPAAALEGCPAEPDFVYTDDELRQMRQAIDDFASSGLLDATRGDGFVFGVLRKEVSKESGDGGGGGGSGGGDGDRFAIDVDRNRELVAAARPYACVFHRAFDPVVADAAATNATGRVEAALAVLRDECGFVGVLTAGGMGTRGAVDHANTLQRLVKAGAADVADATDGVRATESRRIEIIVGGGVRSRNLAKLVRAVFTGMEASPPSVSFHASCLDAAAATQSGAAGEAIDGEEVARIVQVLDALT
ncbi:copper homeostasis protein [Niveomyces insectorum RCEF 264]|uniref:Copper homeostasis protein cutC homolog n=1 Tax=Niveomyces insectorum RCEF 264 TaxID=1081102 RepID=A0A167MFD1_9HYPO|nr:copper homeostasis protein [Niveomyces insectorum RCEF 264]